MWADPLSSLNYRKKRNDFDFQLKATKIGCSSSLSTKCRFQNAGFFLHKSFFA